VRANSALDRALGFALLITTVIGVYLVFEKTNRTHGDGGSRRLFLN